MHYADLEKSSIGMRQRVTEQQSRVLDVQKAWPVPSGVYRVSSVKPIRKLLQLPVAAENEYVEAVDRWRHQTSIRCEDALIRNLIRRR